MPTPPPPKPKVPKVASPPRPAATPAPVAKTFKVAAWDGANDGEKIVLYAASGMGKTTLASMLPDPVFIGIDDGGRRTRDPRSGKSIRVIEGIETFQDVRDALRQPGLLSGAKSLVIDTGTRLEELATQHVISTMKTEKGQAARSIEQYGYGKGYRHVADEMKLVLADLDALIRQGINVCILCQEAAITVANVEGADYLQDGPRLIHNKLASSRADLCEWADHVFRIGYLETHVVSDNGRTGKVVSQDTTRCVYTHNSRHFFAKSRLLKNGGRLDPAVSFADVDDDSLWTLVFGD
jgi:hypothetical protein